MHDLINISTTTSSFATNGSILNSGLLQSVLTSSAQQTNQFLAMEFKQAYDYYNAFPNQGSAEQLQQAIDQTLKALRRELKIVQKAKRASEKRLAKASANSNSYLTRLGDSLKHVLGSFFGSDEASLVSRYGAIAQKHREDISALSQLREALTVQIAGQQSHGMFTSSTMGDPDSISPASRRLLTSQTLPETTIQFCYPSGSCDLSTLYDGLSGFVLQGEVAGDYSGYSVSSAGDINGDGINDLLVGAYQATPAGRTKAGKTYVVFGSNQNDAWGSGMVDLSTLTDGIHGFVLQGEAAGDYSGYSVSNAGDINGDGINDLLVGAYQATPAGRSKAGKTYVVFGSNQSNAWGSGVLDLNTLVDGTHGFVLQGEVANDYSGFAVSNAGDINGDGLDDLLIGAYLATPAGRSYAGKTYVVFGSNQANAWGSGVLDLSTLMDGTRGFALQGETVNDQSGISVSSAGDINGDDLADMLVGAQYADPAGRTNAGKTYVVFGSNQANAWGLGVLNISSLMDGQCGFALQGEAANDNSGASVGGADDINGDGLADIIVGAQYATTSTGLANAGKTYVIFGSHQSNAWSSGALDLSTLANGQRGFMLQGETSGDRSGIYISSAEDINGDGLTDLLVGASYAAPNNYTRAGKTYVVLGSSQTNAWGSGALNLSALIDGVRGFGLNGETVNDYSGQPVSNAGDINGDGAPDLVLGVHYADPANHTDAGKTYVIFGASQASLRFTANHLRLAAGDGSAVRLNSSMLALTSNRVDTESQLFTVQNLAHGNFSAINAPSTILSSFYLQNASNGIIQFTHDASAIVPAYRLRTSVGNLLSFYSNAQIDFSNPLDGSPETVMQFCYPSGSCGLGTLYDGVVGFLLQGEVGGDNSGYSVSNAGDINGDGIDDLLVGAYNAIPAGRFNAGKTYVVFGSNQANAWGSGVPGLSSLMDGVRGFVLQGESAGDHSGYSVSNAGDVNGDGVDDLLVGAYNASPAGRSAAGKTYVVFGSNQPAPWGSGVLDLSVLMDGMRGFVLQGEAAGDQSGYSVSNAGDINGDGVDDLLVGTYGAASGSGKTYVVFGSRQVNAWGSGVMDLSTLMNGTRGFVLQGEASDYSGCSVSNVGDVNGDGIGDLLVGAFYATPSGRSAAGKTYVVFGSRQTNAWGSGTLDISTLINGTRGFVLQGEASSDYSGYSVSNAGDINGDGLADLLVGAWRASPVARDQAGKTYVVFGSNQTNAWGSGVLDLSSLMDGMRGFVLQGEAASAYSGYSVSSAGDINGDGIDDLLVGAYGAASGSGKTYVVFGSCQVNAWGSGVLDLSTLINGVCGFGLQGEAGDGSGYSVSNAGDIDGDGISDLLVGVPNAPRYSYAGKTYVIFGASLASLRFTANNLRTTAGETVLLNNGILALTSNRLNTTTQLFTVQNLAHGSFSAVNASNVTLSSFYLQNVTNGMIQFTSDMSSIAPAYRLRTSIGSLVSFYSDVQVDFSASLTQSPTDSPTLTNSPTRLPTKTPSRSPTRLPTQIPTASPSRIPTRSPTASPNGVPTDSPIENPTDVPSEVPTDSPSESPTFLPTQRPSVSPSRGPTQSPSRTPTFSPSKSPTRSPSRLPTVFPSEVPTVSPSEISTNAPTENPTLSPSQGPSVSPSEVQTDGPTENPTFSPSQRPTVSPSGSPTLSPSQTPTVFPSRNPTRLPSLAPTVSPSNIPTDTPSGSPTLSPNQAPAPSSTFLAAPILIHNQLNITNGTQPVTLTLVNLQATDADTVDSNILFTANNVKNGYFTILPNTNAAFTFTQAQIQNLLVQFNPTGNAAPSYSIIVSDGTSITDPMPATVFFQNAPVIQHNAFNITQNSTTILTPDNLNVTVTDGSTPTQIVLQITGLQSATISFIITGQLTTNFTLNQLQAGEVQITQDGSATAPSFTVVVTGQSAISSAPSTSTVQFTNTQGITAPYLLRNYLKVIQGHSTLLDTQHMQASLGNGGTLDSNALFYVSGIDHGAITYTTNPSTSLPFFSQSDLQGGIVQFTHDGSFNLPSYQLAVEVQGLRSANLPASIFFQAVPFLASPLTEQEAVVGQQFTYVIPSNTFKSAYGQPLTLSVGMVNSSQGLPIAFNPSNNRFTGTFNHTGFYDIAVTATDPFGFNASTDFVIKALSSPITSAGHTPIINMAALVGGLLGGAAGLGLLVMLGLLGRKYCVSKKTKEERAKKQAWHTLLDSIRALVEERGLPKKKVFISYAWPPQGAERDALQAFLKRLQNDFKRAGIKVFLDVYDMQGNMDITMHTHLEESDFIMPILTKKFLARVQEASPNNLQFEFNLMMEKAKNNPHCLLPILHEGKFGDVVLQEPLIPLAKHMIYSLQAKTRIEPYLVCLSDPLGIIPVIHGIKFGDSDYQKLLHTWLESSLTQIPQPLPNAIERDKLMARLFMPQDAKSTASSIHVIQGIIGVGKTQLATAYANTHSQDKDFVRLIPADKHNLEDEWQHLGELLGLDLKGKPEAEQRQAIKEALSERKSWLIVLDNLENQEALEGLLPQRLLPTQQVLITTRSEHWDQPVLALPPFTPEECQTYFERRLKLEQCVGADKLAQELGYLPLALAHAVVYIKEADTTAKAYLKLYKEKGIALLARAGARNNTVLTIYQLSIEQLAAKNPAAAELVKHCAYLYPEGIKKSFLKKLLNIDDEIMNECIRDIRHYSLLSKGNMGFNMHPLTQAAIRHNETDDVFITRLRNMEQTIMPLIAQTKDPVEARKLELHHKTILNHLQAFALPKDLPQPDEEVLEQKTGAEVDKGLEKPKANSGRQRERFFPDALPNFSSNSNRSINTHTPPEAQMMTRVVIDQVPHALPNASSSSNKSINTNTTPDGVQMTMTV